MTKAVGAYSTRSPDAGQIPNTIVNPHGGPPVSVPGSSPTRRAALGALAGGALVAATGLAVATVAPDHPDRAIFALGQEYDRLDAALNAAGEALDRCSELFEEAKPNPSDVLRHTIKDHVFLWLPFDRDHCRGFNADIQCNDFYTAAEVKMLPYAQPPWNVENIPIAKARAAEITAEFDRWDAECQALRSRFGVDEAAEAHQAAIKARRECAVQIAAARATTLAGLRVRAKIVAEIYDGDLSGEGGPDTIDQVMIWATMRDLASIGLGSSGIATPAA